jgi:hypothetical protein
MRRSWRVATGLALLVAGEGIARATSTCASSFFGPQFPDSLRNASVRAFGDIDGDGVIDRIWLSVELDVDYHTSAGAVRSTSTFTSPDGQPLTFAIIADVDGVGGAEIVTGTDSRVFVVTATTGGALTLLGELDVQPLPANPFVAAGRFRTRSQADVVVQTASGTFVPHHFAAGAFSKGPALAGLVPATSLVSNTLMMAMAAADIDGDGLDDLLFPSADGIAVARLGTRAAWDTFADLPTDGPYSAVVAADFDGDGRVDVAADLQPTQNFFTPPLRTWMQSTSGALKAIPDVPSTFEGSPLFAGDLTGDGAAEIVTAAQVGRWAGTGWQFYDVVEHFQTNYALADATGDGLLDLVGDGANLYGILPGALADIAITAMNPPPSVDAGQSTSLNFAVTNNGPSRTFGLALTASVQFATFAIPGCPTADCSTLAIDPGQTIPVTVTFTAPADPSTVTVSACSTLFDPIPGNDTAKVTFSVAPRADLAVVVVGNVGNGAFDIEAAVGNNGPSTATKLVLSTTLPVGAAGTSWTSNPAAATCAVQGNIVTCNLDALASAGSWTVDMNGSLSAVGQAAVSSTISSDVADPNPSNNTDGFTFPVVSGGGPLGVVPGLGCGCGLVAPTPDHPSGVVLVTFVAALIVARVRRRTR